MARGFVSFAVVCVVVFFSAVSLVSAGDERPVRVPFIVHGKVYCDTCQAGFETTATKYIGGAKVKLDCRDRDNQKLVRYTAYGETNPAGEFEFEVSFDHGDDICKCSLISSPLPNCSKIAEGRESAEVFLTNNNGIISNHRHANNLGFVQDHQSAGCAQVMKQYQPLESEYL